MAPSPEEIDNIPELTPKWKAIWPLLASCNTGGHAMVHDVVILPWKRGLNLRLTLATNPCQPPLTRAMAYAQFKVRVSKQPTEGTDRGTNGTQAQSVFLAEEEG
eukprot:2643147-Amphidinium_carterae.1